MGLKINLKSLRNAFKLANCHQDIEKMNADERSGHSILLKSTQNTSFKKIS